MIAQVTPSHALLHRSVGLLCIIFLAQPGLVVQSRAQTEIAPPAPILPIDPAVPDLLRPQKPVLPPEMDDQTPVPEPEPSAGESPPPVDSEPAPAPQPRPTPPPTMREMVDALAEREVRSIVSLLRSSYVNNERLDDAGLARSQLHGLLIREDPAIQLLPPGAPQDVRSGSFASDLIEGIGYIRAGALNSVMLEHLDRALAEFATQNVSWLILDLRASGASGDANLGAEVLRRFQPAGTPLFTIRSRAGGAEDKLFTANRTPLFTGRILVLIDADVRGPSEIIAGVLAQQAKALLVGAPTVGQMIESAEIILNGGRVLRYAIGIVEIEGLDAGSGKGLVPDVPVEVDLKRKWEVFDLADRSGVSATVAEVERPRMNEAALVAGRNPELAQLEALDDKGRLSPDDRRVFDTVLKRGLDAAISLRVLAP